MVFIPLVSALCIIFKKNVQLAKKGKIDVNTAGRTTEKVVAVSGVCRHCPLSQAAEKTESTKAVGAVGLTIRNAEFIHVISLSLLISYSQLKMGAERES